MVCPSPEQFARLVDGELSESELAALEAHLADCSGCARVATLMVDSDGEPARPWLAAGDRVGRYVIDAWIGSGGMGEVYAARDPTLARAVAVKLVRGAEAEDEARLLTEARTMATLSHPNVLAVYDAGTVETRSFIAMELVRGEPLDAWSRGRAGAAMVDALIQVGRGIAAAHDAGLLHRDVKPSNVLVGEDGRVRVSDFGLARTIRADAGEADRTPVGTPRYIAPEVLSGRGHSPSSDQFSFCAMALELLVGRSALDGRLRGLERAGEFREALGEARQDARIPGPVADAFGRGLRSDPGARWPTMSALVGALERARRGRSRWRSLAVAGAVVAAAATGVLASRLSDRARPEPSCASEAAEVAAVWNPDRRAQLREQFLALDLPHAEDAWGRIARLTDRYVESWQAERAHACTDAYVAHTQSPEGFERRSQCLRGLLNHLDLVLSSFGEMGHDVDVHVVSLHRMTPPQECRAAVFGPAQQPTAQQTAALDGIRERVVAAQNLVDAGEVDRALAIARPLLAQVEQVGYPPAEAEVLFMLGYIEDHASQLDRALEHYRRALTLAQAGGVSDVSARAALAAASIELQKGATEGVDQWIELAAANAQRLGSPPELTARVFTVRARLAQQRSDLRAQLEALTAAAAIYRDALGERSAGYALALADVARVRGNLGDSRVAIEGLRRAVEICDESLGPLHPETLKTMLNLGAALGAAGQHDEAIDIAKREIARREQRYGSDSEPVASALANFASSAGDLGRTSEALAALLRARDIYRERANRENLGLVELSLARLESNNHRLDEALAYADSGLATLTDVLGSKHVRVSHGQLIRGAILSEAGRKREAVASFDAALATQVAALGEAHPLAIHTRGNRALALQALGRSAAQRELIDTLEQSATSGVPAAFRAELAAAIAPERLPPARRAWLAGVMDELRGQLAGPGDELEDVRQRLDRARVRVARHDSAAKPEAGR